MLEIKLSGDSAIEYIDHMSKRDMLIGLLTNKVDDLEATIVDLESKNTKLTLELANTVIASATKPSSGVLNDTEKLKGIRSGEIDTVTGNLFNQPMKVFNHSPFKEEKPTYVSGTWTQGDLDLIEARMHKSDINKDRTLNEIAKALGREKEAVRAKLTSLGIQVKQGMCYFSEDL